MTSVVSICESQPIGAGCPSFCFGRCLCTAVQRNLVIEILGASSSAPYSLNLRGALLGEDLSFVLFSSCISLQWFDYLVEF